MIRANTVTTCPSWCVNEPCGHRSLARGGGSSRLARTEPDNPGADIAGGGLRLAELPRKETY